MTAMAKCDVKGTEGEQVARAWAGRRGIGARPLPDALNGRLRLARRWYDELDELMEEVPRRPLSVCHLAAGPVAPP
jgi:hypothetical protein